MTPDPPLPREHLEALNGHTPGPWRYRPGELDDWGVVRGPDGTLIARASHQRSARDLDDHRAAGTDPAEANARLIAAAPEVLSAALAATARAEAAETQASASEAIVDAENQARLTLAGELKCVALWGHIIRHVKVAVASSPAYMTYVNSWQAPSGHPTPAEAWAALAGNGEQQEMDRAAPEEFHGPLPGSQKALEKLRQRFTTRPTTRWIGLQLTRDEAQLVAHALGTLTGTALTSMNDEQRLEYHRGERQRLEGEDTGVSNQHWQAHMNCENALMARIQANGSLKYWQERLRALKAQE